MNPIKIDFKKELESASRGMIMIRDPKLLIRLIVRMIVRKLGVRHVGMILHDTERNCYVLNISKGEKGFKIPEGFTRFNKESAIIKLFDSKEFKPLIFEHNGIVAEDINRLIWRQMMIGKLKSSNGDSVKDLETILYDVNDQMEMLNAVACVPAYYRNHLMAILLLGEKYDGTRFDQEELAFFAALASDAAMAIRNAQLFKHLKQEAEKNHQQFMQTIAVLTHTIEAKDPYTHGHSQRVTDFSLQIAHQMVLNGEIKYSKKFFDNLYISSLLHDVGKIGIPEAILNKKGRLTDEEYTVIKNHPVRGVEIISPLMLDRECLDGIRHHHERYDGVGYPQGLKGAEIPLISTIISVADTYDAMTSDRPYRQGLAKEFAMAEIKTNAGTQFHPKPALALLQILDEVKV